MVSVVEKHSSKSFSKSSQNTSKYDDEGEEQLYLLEVIIDKIDVFKEGILETFQESQQPTASNGSLKDTAEASGPLRVLVKFFDFPTIEIQEREFKKENHPTEAEGAENETQDGVEEENAANEREPLISENDTVIRSKKQEATWKAEGRLEKEILKSRSQRFVSGKSCLFPMVPKYIVEVIRKYPLEIQVHRDATSVDPAHLIGTTRLNLGMEFIDAVSTACTPSVLPVTAQVQGEYGVSNVFGDATGTINLLVRMSCFGPTIFTQFKYIQGQQGFKFSTSEGVMSSRTNQDMRMKAEKKSKSKSDTGEDNKLERPPLLSQDTDIAMFTSPALKDVFKVPVPWRKLSDEPISPQTCGPKRLFKDIAKPRTEETFSLEELFPSVDRTYREQRGFYPMGPIITGNTFEDCSCRGQAIPPTSGQLMFSQQTDSFAGGPGRGVLEIPPGTIFPCQFGQSWVQEAQICECPSPKSKEEKKFKNIIDLFPCPYYSNTDAGKNAYLPQQSQSNPQPDVGGFPLMNLSHSQTSRCDYPCLEQASPMLRSAPPLNTSESQAREFCCTIDEPCVFGSKNNPNGMMAKSSASAKPRCNFPNTHKNGVQHVSCPAPTSGHKATVVCGLEGLLDPNQWNLPNLLQPTLMDPVCPPDSSRTKPSLCSCPKVAKPMVQPLVDGKIKCECTNILTTMKPMDLTYTCQQKLDSQLTSVQTPMTTATIPPAPNKQAHPNPECPLANLLKKAEQDAAADHSKANTAVTDVVETSSKSAIGTVDKDELAQKKFGTVSEPTLKTVNASDDQPQGKTNKKVAEKARKMLQEEIAHINMASDVTEPTMTSRADGTKASKASSLTSQSLSSKKKSKKKKEMDANRNPPPGTITSIYPGSHIGHKDCVPNIRWVPKKMGWLWNIKDADGYMKPARGWRPGSIPTKVIRIMENVKTSKDKSEKKAIRPYKKVEAYKHMAAGGGDGPLFKPVDDTPTVHVHKKHGKLYLSLCSPPKEAKKDRSRTKTGKGESVNEESDEDSNRPAQFRIDLKNPDGLNLDSDLYETEETSSNSEDSYQIEIVAPSTLRNRQPQPVKIDFEGQVTEENFLQLSHDNRQAHGLSKKKLSVKMERKRSIASKRSVKQKLATVN